MDAYFGLIHQIRGLVCACCVLLLAYVSICDPTSNQGGFILNPPSPSSIRLLSAGTSEAFLIGKRRSRRKALAEQALPMSEDGMHRNDASVHKQQGQRSSLLGANGSSSDGGARRRRLAQAGSGNYVIVWNLSSSLQIATLTAHTDVVTSTAFSPNGLQLASGSSDGSVRLWSVPAFRLVALLTGQRLVSGVAWAPDNVTLASSALDM